MLNKYCNSGIQQNDFLSKVPVVNVFVMLHIYRKTQELTMKIRFGNCPKLKKS